VPRQIVGLVLAVLILASLFGGRSLVANVADGPQHVVKPGETLSAIAAQYGLTVDQLMSANGITDPDRLAEGQALKLPSTTARSPGGGSAGAASANAAPAAGAPAAAGAPPAARTSEYVVQAGDTLGGIAKALGISLKALMDANADLPDPDRLSIGQKLSVPAGASAPAPTSGASTARNGQAPAAASSASTATTDEATATLDKLAQQYGVDASLLRALAWIDTDGKPRRLDAPGALGYLTVTDKTFEYIQQTLVKRTLDRDVPGDNLEAGVAYVASMLKWGGDEPKGLAGFLQGPGSVRENGVRPNIDQQVKRILALRDKLKSGGSATTASASPGAGSGPGAQSSEQQRAAAPTPRPVPATATPVPARPASPASDSAANLTARAIAAARTVSGDAGRIGISGRNLVTGQRLGAAADQTFPAASVGKLGLLVELYRQSAAGSLTLTDNQKNDIKAMIVQSDNDAANRLLEALSAKAVNANLQALGLVGTKLVNPFGLARAVGNPSNVTTPADMARLMEMLANGQLVSATASKEMRGLLLQSQDGSKLRRGLPADARVAHKSGWYDGVANDVGIVSQGQSLYVLGVFTEGIADAETANRTIAAVAEVVHGAWGPPTASTVSPSPTTNPASLAASRRR
jgi:LysM repeat protein/beta-lactamase class A